MTPESWMALIYVHPSLPADISIFQVVVEECQALVSLRPAVDSNQGTTIIDMTGEQAISWADTDETLLNN